MKDSPRWRFPLNRQAAECTLYEQMDKVCEEVAELDEATRSGDTAYVCREAWDVVQAVEGILRRCPDHVVERARADVMLRCSRRGDYGEISDIE